MSLNLKYPDVVARDVNVSFVPHTGSDGGFQGFFALAQDVSERKRAEAALRESEARAVKAQLQLLDAIESISDGFVLFDAEDRLVACNERYREIYSPVRRLLVPGASFEEILHGSAEAGIVPEACGREDQWIVERLARHLNPEGSYEVQLSDGRLVQVTERKTGEGGIVGICTDITERKRAIEALRESENRYRDLCENAPAAYMAVRVSNGSILHTNRMMRELLGYTGKTVNGIKFLDLFAESPDGLAKAERVFERSKRGKSVHDVELQMKRKDGELTWISMSVEPMRDAEGNVTEARSAFTDITDRKHAEAQMVQASKLAALGEMSTSVAHELNQPLNVIRLAVGNAIRKLEKGIMDPSYFRDKLGRIASQTERAAAIIDHMRMFGRKAEVGHSDLDPRDAVRGALDFMSSQLRLARIEVSADLPDTCPLVLGCRVSLEQVILNLLTNARDAIQANHGERKITLAVDGSSTDSVQIVVGDTGGGIPQGAMPWVFDPFYTTKKMGEGTGLGLSVSYGIVRDMGGTITAENTGSGAKFTVTLPAVEKI